MKLIKSKFFIIMLCIALALVIVPSVLTLMGLSSYVRSAVATLLTPAQSLMMKVTNAIDGFTDYFTEFDRLKAENEALKRELAEYKNKFYEIDNILKTNEWLYEYLELKREHTEFKLIDADIVGREVGNYMTVFTLNVGTDKGVTADMPVITSDGIVGYIAEAGPNWSKVLTIIESASAVGAYVERTGELGLVEGSFDLRGTGLCKLTYLATDSDVKVGDRVLSSGLGSIYPRGLVVGIVESIEPDQFSRTVTAYVRPTANLEDLTRVMVIKSYETYAE
ncbi:MAG: rod shape-determining protein MreC [Clostridiales bacterium]|nr:rod shape-determining protein MreC [Clostridiales bacterium]